MSRPTIPDRARWAVAALEPAPGEQILEIGAGTSATANLLCPLLTSGRLTSLDRSATAVRRIASGAAEHLAQRRLTVVQSPLAELDRALGPEPPVFDAAFCVNVNAFWTGHARAELSALRRRLRPGGRLLVLYGSGPRPNPDRKVLASVIAALEHADFTAFRELVAPEGYGVVASAAADSEAIAVRHTPQR